MKPSKETEALKELVKKICDKIDIVLTKAEIMELLNDTN